MAPVVAATGEVAPALRVLCPFAPPLPPPTAWTTATIPAISNSTSTTVTTANRRRPLRGSAPAAWVAPIVHSLVTGRIGSVAGAGAGAGAG
ncbi:MAG TPA: hypothetical protein K8W00_11590, partial [Kitasatospora aureofaciens]|uniref:hypothetical protein n=1 Tax=Kitasatospora aureofaciens TaxID=1894 RepID=UPI001DBB94AA